MTPDQNLPAEVVDDTKPVGETEDGARQAPAGDVRAAQLAETLEAKEEELRSLRDQLLRNAADFENYKRRQQNSQDEMRLAAKERILEAVLPLQDNLVRAMDAAQKTENLPALLEGLNLVVRQMKELLSKEGVSEIAAAGERFDPAVHHAVATEDRDDMPDETVVEEFQKGYKLGDRLLRPSLVKVSRSNG